VEEPSCIAGVRGRCETSWSRFAVVPSLPMNGSCLWEQLPEIRARQVLWQRMRSRCGLNPARVSSSCSEYASKNARGHDAGANFQLWLLRSSYTSHLTWTTVASPLPACSFMRPTHNATTVRIRGESVSYETVSYTSSLRLLICSRRASPWVRMTSVVDMKKFCDPFSMHSFIGEYWGPFRI
jgi:hypothetical protein